MGAPLSDAQEGSGVSSETYMGHSRKRFTFAYRFQNSLPVLALIIKSRMQQPPLLTYAGAEDICAGMPSRLPSFWHDSGVSDRRRQRSRDRYSIEA